MRLQLLDSCSLFKKAVLSVLKEVKALLLMCHFVIVYRFFCQHASKADWFNLQIVKPHSLEELKAPQLQMFQHSGLFCYHCKVSQRGEGCLVLFIWKLRCWGAFVSPVFRENLLTGCWSMSAICFLALGHTALWEIKTCLCSLPLTRSAPILCRPSKETQKHRLYPLF